jgi:thiamine transport system substrate-binding protein
MRRAVVVALIGALTVAACGGKENMGDSAVPATEAKPTEVTLLAYDAFTPAEGVFTAFTEETGARVKVVTGGDSGTVISKAILTAGNPEGDVLWGVDNTTLSRAQDAGLLESYEPVDTGDVCVNYSKNWYASRGLQPPTGLDDLVKPQYRGQLVVQDAVNSSPGLAFLMATVAKYGDGWQQWWRALMDNDTKVVSDWTTAWTVEYAGGGNPGTRPLVVSYGSSPPAEIVYAADPSSVTEPDSGVIESTCFRQTEYAGVLRGTRNPGIAQKLAEYLLDRRFQESMPLSLFVFPVNNEASLPEVFAKWAVKAADPLSLPAADIAANRDRWLDEWRAIAL